MVLASCKSFRPYTHYTTSIDSTSEAVTVLLDYAKEHINVDYIVAYADTGNIGSTRVMEKCGMVTTKLISVKALNVDFTELRIDKRLRCLL